MKAAQAAFLAGVMAALLLAGAEGARAHCDGLDGPVVKAAQQALERKDVNLALVWVRPQDEAEIKQAFERALTLRKMGREAAGWADLWFFETLVRVHRAGEGAAYTGLKPAGRDLGPAIPAADRALDQGSEEELIKLVVHRVEEGIRERFRKTMKRKTYDAQDVSAGRDYVQAYVEYVHYVERLYEAAQGPAHGHYSEGSPDEKREHDHK